MKLFFHSTALVAFLAFTVQAGVTSMTAKATTDVVIAKTSTNRPAWQTDLSKMGITLDPETASRAMMLASVQTIDPKARIITEEAWTRMQDERSGWAITCGIRLSMSNGLPVIAAMDDTLDAITNLLAGDCIIGIGTNLPERTTLPQAQAMLRTGAETNGTLLVQRDGVTNSVDVAFTRRKLPAIETAELLPNRMGYIKVNGLFTGSGPDLVSRVRAWSETEQHGLVLDLRGAGGDDLASVTQVASLYAQGTQALFTFKDHRTNDVAAYKAQESRTVEMPLMVLIDGQTHGAAETLAAALNHVARPALLLGEPTAGDFNLREAVKLDGELVYMVTRVLNTADGWRYNGQFGVEPDIVMGPGERSTHDYDPPENLLDRRQKAPEEAEVEAVRRRVRGDGLLERAVDILTGLKTLHGGEAEVSLPTP